MHILLNKERKKNQNYIHGKINYIFLFYRCVKYSLPSIPDFETLFVQTQEFINSCNGEQVRYATDSCEYRSCIELCYDLRY